MDNDKLKAIATKYEVPENQIQIILNILSVKAENPSETQLKGFEKVCELIKSGTPLERAAQAVATEAKAKSTPKTTESKLDKEKENNHSSKSNSLTVRDETSSVTLPNGIQSLDEDVKISSLLREEVDILTEDFEPSNALLHVTEGMIERSQQVSADEYYRNYGKKLFDEAVAEKSQRDISVEDAKEIIAKTKKKFGL
jgi:hypothetical protein